MHGARRKPLEGLRTSEWIKCELVKCIREARRDGNDTMGLQTQILVLRVGLVCEVVRAASVKTGLRVWGWRVGLEERGKMLPEMGVPVLFWKTR